MNEMNPAYVVVGETRASSFEKIERAVNLVRAGAKLFGTNPDLKEPIEKGVAPPTGSLVASIELATGIKAYFVGKPNQLMMQHALKIIGCKREETVIVGDRMDTNIIAGIHTEIAPVMILSGVTGKRARPLAFQVLTISE